MSTYGGFEQNCPHSPILAPAGQAKVPDTRLEAGLVCVICGTAILFLSTDTITSLQQVV